MPQLLPKQVAVFEFSSLAEPTSTLSKRQIQPVENP